MATFEYSVDGQSIITTKAGRLVSGTIGVYTVKFTFDSSWDGLEKWATFDPNPGDPYKQPLDANGECEIPGEVMGGLFLRIGAFGLADGQAYPTVWANRLTMDEGCYVEVPESDWPEPSPIIEEILEELETKVDKPDEATPGNVAIFDTNRNIADSGKSLSDIYDSAMISKTVSGDIVTIEDGAEVPVKDLTVEIFPHYNLDVTPSASSPLTITGYSRIPMNIAGKNLMGGKAFADQIKRYMPSATIDEDLKRITFSNGATTYVAEGGMLGIRVKDDTRYTVVLTLEKTSVTNLRTNVTLRYTDGTASQISMPEGTAANQKVTIVVSTAASKQFSELAKSSQGGSTRIYYDECGIFEGVVTLADFVPYAGYQIQQTLPVEVYRGTWKPLTGKLLVRPVYNSYAGETLKYPVLSSIDGYLTSGTPTTGAMVIDYGGDPTEYQLDPVSFSTHKGLNTLWAGFYNYYERQRKECEFSAVYRADPDLAMDEKTKAVKLSIAKGVEDGFTASQAYLADDIFYVGDTLYRATTSIANGATITPNTNCVKTTVMEYVEYALYG